MEKSPPQPFNEDLTGPSLAVAIKEIAAAVDDLLSVDLHAEPARELLAGVADVAVVSDRLNAAAARLTDQVDRDAAYKSVDGHLTPQAFLRTATGCTANESSIRMHICRMLRFIPNFTAAYQQGDIAEANVRLVARTFANPRIDDNVFAEADNMFTAIASHATPAVLREALATWITAADPDGAHHDTAATHRARRVHLSDRVDNGITIDGRFGSLQGAVLKEVLIEFEQTQLEADWATARTEHGERATADQLPRTPAQRRADALVAIFTAAASATPGIRQREPLLNIVVSDNVIIDEFNRRVRHASDDQRHRLTQALAAEHPDLSRTLDGSPISSTDALDLLFTTHIRRVIMNSESVVLDMGRTQRFFTGTRRDALNIADQACVWAQCLRPSKQCQGDHLTQWQHGGPTAPYNGAPKCGGHNRLATHGFTTHRQPDGTWKHLRPDGTQITRRKRGP